VQGLAPDLHSAHYQHKLEDGRETKASNVPLQPRKPTGSWAASTKKRMASELDLSVGFITQKEHYLPLMLAS